jgi:phage regulator Rha-like protein
VFYGIGTKVLNQAVKRNVERFPENFMFQLDEKEAVASRSQFVTLKRGANIKYLPYAFTEHGVVMLSSVLKSKRAVQVSIAVVSAFIKMREYLSTHKQILDKLKKHDENFVIIFDVLRQLTDKPKTAAGKYGFKAGTVKPI